MRMRGDINIYRLLHNLKHGYQILSPKNWVSLSQFRIFAGVLGVTGLILAIKDGKIGYSGLPSISESGDSSEKLLLVPGLRNLGNNCFLNVILQALASCECFHPFLQNIIERDGYSDDERVESMPLTVALYALFRELCKPRDERSTLNPRTVMLAMDHYIPSFNLTRQQDAAEAFLHLLSSLKEETSECYVPDYGSLAEISTFPECKISRPNRREGLNEQERWQQDFLGPFNGILGSSLTCKTCSSQLSVDFEFFLSLPLSPLLDDHGCSVEHCLKQFTAAELIDNYRCNRCWHIAAIKYFFTAEGHESQIEKLNSCVEEDSCDCRNLFPQGVPWPNNISRTLKQLSIVRCPKILCIHLQRASVNEFGELVKLQGHISFPMLLDLFPYTQPVVGVRKESLGENVEIVRVNQLQSPITRFDHFNMQFSTQMLQHIYGRTGENINILSEQFVGDEVVDTNDSAGDKCTQASKPESGVHHSDGCSYPEFMDLPLQPIIGRTGENMNISSEPLVGDMVGDANDFVGDKSTRALKPESGVHHSEGCSYPELTGMPLQPICGWTGENINISSESLVGDEVGNTDHSAGDKFTQALKPESGMHHSEGCCSYPKFTGLPLQSDDKINNSCHLVPSKSYMYRLVSVVEHFGRVGSGHYTVYRRARKSDDSSSVEQLGRSHVGWFCISDSNVLSVSERDVLAADASLLFYEKIQELS